MVKIAAVVTTKKDEGVRDSSIAFCCAMEWENLIN